MAKGKYHEWLETDGLLRLEAWARDGLTDKQIAHNIGVTEQTLNVWKKKYPSFSESLKRGKEIIDIEVENALLKRAMGFKYEETKIIEENKDGVVTHRKETIKKHALPDTTAQIFWLKNRKSHVWRDKQVETPDEKEGDGIRNWIEATQGEKEEGLFDGYEE